MRGALAGNPVGAMEEARKTLMAAYQSAKPAGKKALQKFLDDPEAFTALPEQVIERLARGDVSAVADAARFTSFPSRTAGQWVPPEGGLYSPEAIALGAGTAGAVGIGVAAGGAVANPKPSSPADLSDGLAGAPQDDITPEPVAGEAPIQQAAPIPPSPQPLAESPKPTPVPTNWDRFGNPVYDEDPTPEPAGGWSQRPEGAGFGNYAASMDQQLGNVQQRTLKILLDAGIDPNRAAGIVRGQISMSEMERQAVVDNTGLQQQRSQAGINSRRDARMGAPPPSSQRASGVDLGDYNTGRQGRDETDEEYRFRMATGMDSNRRELDLIRNGGVPPSFDPGSLGDDERLPGVSGARPQSYRNPNTFDPMAQADPRQAFRDFERAEDMRRRSQGVPVEAQRERDFASGQYDDFDQRLQDQSRWAKSMQIDPEGRGIGPNAFQRRYNPKESREWYEQNVVPRIRERARTSELTGEAYNSAEEKIAAEQSARAKDPEYQEKADLANMRARATMDAKSLGMTYEEVINEFDEYAALRGKQSTRDKRFAQRRLNNLNERDAEQDLRRERLATRGLYGLNQAQANAYVALGDPNLSDEQRLAAEYTLNPRKFMVDYAMAQNPPKGDGSGFDPVTDNALKQQYAAGYKSGTEIAKSRMSGNRNWDGTSKVPRNAREWEDWKQEALEGLAINSAEYDGAIRWFENNFGAQPPGDREEPKQSGVPSSGARQGRRRGGR